MYKQPSKQKKQKKYFIWHIQGGLGKNVAATALIPDIKKKYPNRKLIMIVSFPEVFLNHPDIDKIYPIGNHPNFYETYIEGKDVIISKHEPYDQTGHITKQKHLIENWCDLLGLEYTGQIPYFPINYAQNKLQLQWVREKPVLLIQTSGGPFTPPPHDPNFPDVPINPYAWTRDLPIEIAQSIIKKYSSEYHIIQVTKQGGYGLQGVERIDRPLTNVELFSLVAASQKRFFIDSALQHAAAAFRMPSTVFWIGTSPKIFGYDMHTNIVAKIPKKANQLINSYMFDFSFANNTHECPYMSINEMFDLENLDI